MMEQTNIVKLLIAVLCGVMVVGMTVSSDSTANTGVRPTSTDSSPFVCADGSGSINRTLLCNGRIDCLDSSDENPQLCFGISCMNTFPCLNGKCIRLDSRCNGLDDCGDNSDEDRTICQQPPSSHIITCANGQVLKGMHILCNTIYNCMDKSDEFNCSECPGKLICYKGYRCIHYTDVCNGYNDCGDNSDEQSCPLTTRTQTCWGHICPSGKCILYSEVCDGDHDCEDGSDEAHCSSTYTTYDDTSSTYTYSYTKVASGVSVPGVVIFAGGCYGFRRRRMRATTRTTRTTTAAVAVITTTAVASDLPPSYSEVVEMSTPNQGIVNPAFAGSTSVSK